MNPSSGQEQGILGAARRALLDAVLDRIIPAREALPGAGGLGAGSSLESAMRASVPLRRLLIDGLVEIDLESERTAGTAFVHLDADRQDAVLVAIEAAHPQFFTTLVDYTYRGYYTDPRVYAAIGYDGEPPQPHGHTLPAFDVALLDLQKKRAPFWRGIR